MKTSALTGAQLDWAVSLITNPEWGFKYRMHEVTQLDGHYEPLFRPSTEWAHGGPIIEREDISVVRCDDQYGTDSKGFTTTKRIPVWAATMGQHSYETVYGSQGDNWGDSYSIDVDTVTYGPTTLIAAMRVFVMFKLGDEVDLPSEL